MRKIIYNKRHKYLSHYCRGWVSQPYIKAESFRARKPRPYKMTGTYVAHYSIEEIRKKFPNAYKKWTAEEELLLVDHFNQGETIKEIAEILYHYKSFPNLENCIIVIVW